MKKQKAKRIRKSFSQKLAEKLRSLNNGSVDEGSLGDGSGRWVNIQAGLYKLEFTFDMKGETLEGVMVTKDVYQKVDEQKIFGV